MGHLVKRCHGGFSTLRTYGCVDALKAALAKYGMPEVFNTDQGLQLTSLGFKGGIKRAGH